MSEHSSNQQTQKHEILNENLWKVAVKLSWPAVIAMVLYGLNTVFDAIFVGKFIGETALAGVSIVYPLSQVTLGIGSLIGVGAGSALSIAIGAGDKDTQRKLLGNVNYMSIASALLFTGIAWMLAPFLVKMMGGDVNTSPYGLEYFRVTVIGSFFWIIGLAYNMIVRAEGKMKSAASMMAGGLIINIVANYVFIAILGFGVKGAAWGTNIGMIIYTISGLLYFKGSRVTFEAKPFQLSVDKDIQKSILSMGMSSFIMAFMSLVQGLVVLNALSRYGSTMDIAFYGAAYRLFTFLLTPIFGFMRALQPVVGINYGAKQYQRVIESFKVFALLAMITIIPFWLILMISPTSVLGLILNVDALRATDIMNFRIFMVLLPVLPTVFMSMTFFPAINKGKVAAMMGIGRQLIFYVPVMLILPRLLGVQWVYYGATIIDIVVAIWMIIVMRKEFNLLRTFEREILEESKAS